MSNIPYDAQVVYLESTGTQYIDTGFKPNQDTRVICSFEQITTRSIAAPFGCESPRYSAYIISSKFRFDYNSTMTSTQIQVENNVQHVIDFNKNNVYIDGRLNTTFTYGNFTAPNLLLFRTTYNGSYFYGRIYWCKVYDNGVLVRDYIPVRIGNEGCLYDNVSGELFSNAGTDNFILGNDFLNINGFVSSFRRRLLSTYRVPLPNYLCFTALEDGTFTFTMQASFGTGYYNYISYSIDNGNTWVKYDNVNGSQVDATTPTLSAGDKVLWKGKGNKLAVFDDYNGYKAFFSSTNKFDVSGNILSILYEDDWSSYNLQTHAFNGVFRNCSGLVNAEALEIPAFISEKIFLNAFKGCTSLVSAPELPATTLYPNCYYSMFDGCISLISPPSVLPSIQMKSGCYRNMFYGCSNLPASPKFEIDEAASYCCNEMFRGCTKLSEADIQINAVDLNSFYRMFFGCKALKVPVDINASTMANNCFQEMYYGSGITIAPKLSATTLASNCYSGMLRECTDLVGEIKLPAQVLQSACYSYMLSYGVKIDYIMMLATDVSASNCLINWVFDLRTPSPGIFIKHIDAQWTTTGNSGVPTNWTVIYYDPAVDKYYTDQTRATECDNHGNPI